MAAAAIVAGAFSLGTSRVLLFEPLAYLCERAPRLLNGALRSGNLIEVQRTLRVHEEGHLFPPKRLFLGQAGRKLSQALDTRPQLLEVHRRCTEVSPSNWRVSGVPGALPEERVIRDGAFVVKDAEREVKPFANDGHREARLWDATGELLSAAR